MKNFLRCLSAFLACITVLLVLSGCKTDNTDKDSPADTTGEEDTTPSDGNNVVVPDTAIDLSGYTVIRPAGASSDVAMLASQFADYIDKTCGVKVMAKADDKSSSDKEILIGETSRNESKAVYQELRERDWSVSVSGSKIVVAAGSDYILYLALDWLKNNCLEQGAPYAVIGEGKSFSYAYPVSSLTVGGTSVEDVKIAYSKYGNISYTDAAYMLAYSIMDQTGIPVQVGEYKEKSTQKQILVGSVITSGKYLPDGVSVGTGQYAVTESNGNIYIIADTSIGAELGVQKIMRALKNNTDGALELTELCSKEAETVDLDVDKLELADGASLRIMTFNIWRVTQDGSTEIQEDRERIERAKETIKYYSPDVVGFQEYCQVYTAEFTTWLVANGYTVLGNELVEYTDDPRTFYDESQNFTPIAFKTDKFELVASGWHRLEGTYDRMQSETSFYPGHDITWGVLKDKSTGKCFGVSSTHYFHGGDWEQAPSIRAKNSEELVELIKSLTYRYNCSFVAVGDLNSDFNSDAYSVLSGSGILTDARGVAQSEFSSRGALHNYGSLSAPSIAEAIDHMFVTSGIKVMRHKTCINTMTAAASDHYPVIIDIDLTDISYEDYSTNDIDGITGSVSSIHKVAYRG